MKKMTALILIVLLVFLSCSAALAQRADCPVGGFSLILPDQFQEGPLDPARNPELCFYWHTQDNTCSIEAYAYYMGEVAFSDLFQVLDGKEQESGEKIINGMRMLYARTDSSAVYTWMDRGTNVNLYFVIHSNDSSLWSMVDSIINTISFDAGH